MRQYAGGEHAVEIVNASVHADASHHGIGSRLLGALHDEAKEQGITRVVVTSGPRYTEKGWPFWNKHFGTAAHVEKDKYGPGADAPVWMKPLEK